METVKLKEYDLKRVIARARKEYGYINRGDEDLYYPQLGYMEHKIYDVYEEIQITDRKLQLALIISIYDLKSIVDDKEYDYIDIVDDKVIKYAKKLQMLFNPYLNKDIYINKSMCKSNKDLFILPIKCMLRIYDSIDFWRERYGVGGYFKMLEEMVINIMEIGKYPYALEEDYLV